MALDVIQSLITYNYDLHRRMWDSLMQIAEEQFSQPIPYSHGSLRHQMIHLTSVDRRWLAGLKEQPDVGHLKPDDFLTRQSVRDAWEQVAADMTAYVAGLDETRLHQQPAGIPWTVWQVLVHLVNHGTDHRAQILRILHDFGAATFDQDYVLYLGSQSRV